MNKQEVVAHLIMESVGEPTKPRNLQVSDRSDGLFYVKFDTTLQGFNVQNRNRRIYETNAMMESLNSPHIAELLEKKTWLGEAGHPNTKEMARTLTINPQLTSHRINSFHLQGNDILMGNVETLDDGRHGTQMTKNILQGMEPAFSLRALASLIKRNDGTSLVKSKSHIVTYDWVILPSHSNAYRDQSKPIEKVRQAIESAGNTITESAGFPVLESQIKDFIALESTNVNLISNVCEVMKESIELTPDLKHVLLREGTNTYAVNVEDRIRQEIRQHMMRL